MLYDITFANILSVFQLFNACPHTEIKRTFRHGHEIDDVIALSLQKKIIAGQGLLSFIEDIT